MAASSSLKLVPTGDGCFSHSTTIAMEEVSGHHTFRLKGYSRAKEIRNGHYMTLGSFNIGGHSWSLRFYPNGMRSDDCDFFSVLLCRDNELCTSGMPARYVLRLLVEDGKPAASYGFTTVTQGFNKTSHGSLQLIKREVFEKSEYLKDDSFTIRCDIFVAAVEQPTSKGLPDPPAAAVAPPKSDLQKDLANLLWSRHGTDAKIEVGGETFEALRCLLAARSAVFQEKFFGPTNKVTVTGNMQIGGMEPEVFKSMLHFMYTDTLPKMDEGDMLVMADGLISAADIGTSWRG